MKNKSLIIIVIQSFLIISLIWLIVMLGKDKFMIDDQEEIYKDVVIDFTKNINGLKVISLPPSVEKNSNIKYKSIKKSDFYSTVPSYGMTLNIQSLLNFRNALLNINHEISKLKNRLREEEKHLRVSIILNEDNKNIADAVVHEKEMVVNDLKNNLAIAINNKNNILANVRQQWGSTFESLLINPIQHQLKGIFKHKIRLIKITIPSEQLTTQPSKKINVKSVNNPNNKIEVYFLDKAPLIDKSLQGKSYFYFTNSNKLSIGEKVIAYNVSTQNKKEQNMLFIPQSGVVWSDGQPWVYIRISSNGTFIRRPLDEIQEIENGWTIKEGIIKSGDQIVINGAQLLLSEEFKYQIKNENED